MTPPLIKSERSDIRSQPNFDMTRKKFWPTMLALKPNRYETVNPKTLRKRPIGFGNNAMALGRYMMSQFARPHGLLAGIFGAVMNGGNRQVNLRSLEALDVKPGQRVLEVGFGGGGTLEILINEKKCGFVGGLDMSSEMVRAAERKFASRIAEGRMAIRQGEAGAIPWADSDFDRVLSVNSMFYWPDPARGAREIRRVLRPGGLLVLGLRDKAAVDKIGIGRLGYWSPTETEIKALLTAAGFESVSAQSHGDGARGDFIVFRAAAP